MNFSNYNCFSDKMTHTPKSQFSKSMKDNNRAFFSYFNMLKELALNMFEWKNLPDTVDERFLEEVLFDYAHILYFNDEIFGNVVMKSTVSGKLDIYNVPIERMAYSQYNGYTRKLNNENSVLIFNNRTRVPTLWHIEQYAMRLAEIQRTIDINIHAQKTPVLITCDETERLSLENLYGKYAGNQPVIKGKKSLNADSISVLRTDAPSIFPQLQVQKNAVWDEALTFLGIESSNTDKKERLVAEEVNGNAGNIEASRYCMLNERRIAAKKINKMFGTNIEVNFRSNLNTLVNREFIDDIAELEETEEKVEEISEEKTKVKTEGED